jgi:hypothetical protein
MLMVLSEPVKHRYCVIIEQKILSSRHLGNQERSLPLELPGTMYQSKYNEILCAFSVKDVWEKSMGVLHCYNSRIFQW